MQTPSNVARAVIMTTCSFSVNCVFYIGDGIGKEENSWMLGVGSLDQSTEDEAGEGMVGRVSIRCLEIVVALAVEIGEGRGRNIKNISQM